jgi:hypothetical protein
VISSLVFGVANVLDLGAALQRCGQWVRVVRNVRQARVDPALRGEPEALRSGQSELGAVDV